MKTLKLVIGKAWVAPIKCITISNLELQAAVYAAHLSWFVVEELDLQREFFLVRQQNGFAFAAIPEIGHKKFVANRPQKTLDVTKPEQWFYVLPLLNLADDDTREHNNKSLYTRSG